MSIPKVAALLVAVLGALLVVVGVMKATVLAPAAITEATLTAPSTPVVSTAVGVLGLEGPRLEVDASAGSAGRPVFVGIGRAHDVDAYLAQVSHLEVVGDGQGKLLTKKSGTESSLPDPAAADVWVVSARGLGSTNLVWPDAPGQWRMVVAGDGTSVAANKVSFTWSGRTHHSAAPAFISIGLVMIVAGLITLVMLGARSRLGSEDSV